MSKKLGLGPKDAFVDTLRTEEVPPLGEITVGGVSADTKFLVTALCILNNPDLNHFFLVNRVKFKDRLTGTQIFPRNGMALPNGEVYKSPEPSNEEQINNAS
jgi:hypothetical protein